MLLGLLSLCWPRAAPAGLLWAHGLCLLWPWLVLGLGVGVQMQLLQADSGWAQLVTILVSTGPGLLLPLWALSLQGLPQLWLLGPVTEPLVLLQFWGLRGLQQLLLLRGLRGRAASILVLRPLMPVSLPPTSLPRSLLLVFQAPLRGEPQEGVQALSARVPPQERGAARAAGGRRLAGDLA